MRPRCQAGGANDTEAHLFIVSSRPRRVPSVRDDNASLAADLAAPSVDADDDTVDSCAGWHASSWALRAGLDVREGDLHDWQACRDALQRPSAPAPGEAC